MTAATRERGPPAPFPTGHWENEHLHAALRCDAMTAPWVIDGAVNGHTFRAWIKRVLAPTLAQGDIVVILASTRSPACARWHAAPPSAICRPYTPDVRQAQWDAMARALDTFTP